MSTRPELPLRIFVSSVQKELADERRAVRDFVASDPLLQRFFTSFLFEDLPARDRRAEAAYLDEVDRCDVYVGIFGSEYGFEDADGLSPTEREFDRATLHGKERLVFVKGADDRHRHPKMLALVRKAGAQLVRRRFGSTHELTAALQASLVDWLEVRGVIQTRPFDERPCGDATLADLDPAAVTDFVARARAERQFPLPPTTPTAEVLAHLHLLNDGRPTNAAVLVFGREPQRFLPAAEVRCMHFHGTDIERPAPFYRIFKGTVFQQVDQAVDFVLSKLDLSIGVRSESNRAPVREEIPRAVVAEAIVNAVAHRDYTSAGAVQVSVFADRVEVWNPGRLLAPLTPESLREPHGSVPRNARICEPLFLTRYIEKYGTGTLMMIRESRAHDLPEPDFAQRGGEFTAAIWRDWLTPAVLARLPLNDRQRKALPTIRQQGRIATRDYQTVAGTTRATAKRDLEDLVKQSLLALRGSGRGAYYEFLNKRPNNGPNGSSPAAD